MLQLYLLEIYKSGIFAMETKLGRGDGEPPPPQPNIQAKSKQYLQKSST